MSASESAAPHSPPLQAHRTLEHLRRVQHPNCFVGRTGPEPGLGVRFSVAGVDAVEATLTPPAAWEGFEGVVHGGIIAALLDGAMVNALFAHGTVAVTAELNVRYWQPLPTGREALVQGRIVRCDPPLYLGEASIVCDGKVCASAKGKFMRIASGTVTPADGTSTRRSS